MTMLTFMCLITLSLLQLHSRINATQIMKTEKHNEEQTVSNIVEFLNSNGLSDLVEQFMNEKISLQDLMDFDDVDLRDYLQSLSIKKSFIIRISSKIKKLKKSSNQCESHQIVHVVLSEEEMQAMNQLDERNRKILSLLQETETTFNALNNSVAKCKIEINQKFDNLLTQIAQKRAEMMNDLSVIQKELYSEIQNASIKLVESERNTTNALDTCNALIENTYMDRLERKQQMLSISNDINSQKLPTDIYIPTNITFSLNTDGFKAVLVHPKVLLWKDTIVHNYDAKKLIEYGWKRVYYEPYSHITTSSELKALCANDNNIKVFVGGIAANDSNTIILGAFGPSSVLHTITSSSKEEAFIPNSLKNTAYSVYWYHNINNGKSFGFSDISMVYLDNADVYGSRYGNYHAEIDGSNRLSWHLTGYGGWRLGNRTVLDSSTEYFKVIYVNR
eukprot:54783_1